MPERSATGAAYDRGIRDERFERWVAALERRHLADLTFSEVSRALGALSSGYVERRASLARGKPLDGAGKRAAFALFYGPLHYLLIREVVGGLPGATQAPPRLVDLGCGTGAAGAAWAARLPVPSGIVGIDRHPWALAEAARTYTEFGLRHRTRQADVGHAALPTPPCALVLAFAVNELTAASREALLPRLLDRAARGDAILVVEPIARSILPWWTGWARAFADAGGRSDEWRFPLQLPDIVAKLDRAAGLDHRELTGRSLWLAGRP
jgi:methyltransferase family protein